MDSNESLEQRVSRLEQNHANMIGVLSTLNSLLGKMIDANGFHATTLLQLWNGQIALLKFVTQTMPNIDEATKQSFLRTVAQMESQTEKLEAMLASLKIPSGQSGPLPGG
jgi:hypothetical protein